MRHATSLIRHYDHSKRVDVIDDRDYKLPQLVLNEHNGESVRVA